MDSRWQPPAVRAFELFFRPWRDARVRTLAAGLPRGLLDGVPLLLAANHVSWWDPFTLRDVQRALRPSAPFFRVMPRPEGCAVFFCCPCTLMVWGESSALRNFV
jgi:hypothetical protein